MNRGGAGGASGVQGEVGPNHLLFTPSVPCGTVAVRQMFSRGGPLRGNHL